MRAAFDDELFRGLGVYQDVVQGHQTVRSGSRDCHSRFERIAPWLPDAGAVLDIGSNFGWFGWKICAERPQCVVASVEADLQSAAVQRAVLQSLSHQRISLLLERAGARMIRRFAVAGQRFEAALCLSVLHWIPDHEAMLTALGAIAGRMFIEHPDPAEPGAGVERIRREIGAIGDYLRRVFPDHTLACLGRTPSNRAIGYERELWMVTAPASKQPVAAGAGLAVGPLLESSVSWPPRSWWTRQLDGLQASVDAKSAGKPRLVLGPTGLSCEGDLAEAPLADWHRQLRRIPETELLRAWPRYYRQTRRLAGRMWRAGRSLARLGG